MTTRDKSSDSPSSVSVSPNRNSDALASFSAYCRQYPEQRFWQALRNWVPKAAMIKIETTDGHCRDPFYWEGAWPESMDAGSQPPSGLRGDPVAPRTVNGGTREKESSPSSLAASPGITEKEHQGPRCINCGDTNDGGYELEDTLGPLCGTCMQRLEDFYAKVHEPKSAPGITTPSEKERDLRLRLAERQIERMALCPDHRDKATGRCIVCQAEERTKEEVRAAQRSAATPAVIAEWQPIETAPKDGTYVILTDGDDVGDGWFDSGVFNGWSWANGYRARPTHWMPLPKPPLASLRAQEGR